ncbi:hypothetical protein VPHK394_0028 [Vibrio phage K394]
MRRLLTMANKGSFGSFFNYFQNNYCIIIIVIL